MNHTRIQEILPLAERPSRYLGTEINTIKKDHNSVKLTMALAFPDLYEIGSSHFGIQILYDILNREKDIAAERVFAPALDMQAQLAERKYPLVSLETHTPLKCFDIIGFSLLYELNYTNVLAMLDLSGIPFLSKERTESDPLVIAGGPCTCNPEPLADFFDALVIGDGETVILELSRAWIEWKKEGGGTKADLLKHWSSIAGVYIPSFFEPLYDQKGFQTLKPLVSGHEKIERAVVPDLDSAPFPEAPILPFGKPVHDRLRLEVSRGCTRGCRFCQAGIIYRPVREKRLERLLDLSEKTLARTGYEDISLLSLSTGDYSGIIPLMETLMARCQDQRVAVSLPSLRAGTLSPELMELIKRVRKTGFTIAPEAGSQRLRDVINKNIIREDIVATVRDAFQLGWQVIKLYFMVGLPTETDADIAELIDLVRELRTIKGAGGRRGKLNVSIATFIPKPHTPFQWCPQISLAESREKIGYLKRALALPGVQVKWQRPEVSILEGLWARGDRRLARLLVCAYQSGCRFDGWSDQFDFTRWEKAMQASGMEIGFFTTRKRGFEETLPWDHIDSRIDNDFLKAEWQNAMTGILTPDCRENECQGCGACDFYTLKPIVFRPEKNAGDIAALEEGAAGPAPKTLEVVYAKEGPARFFGHLELVNIFLRALRRAGVPLIYSQGFHPKPKISFADPLPIGIESLGEVFSVTVAMHESCTRLIKALQENLPQGLTVFECRPVRVKSGTPKAYTADYTVRLIGAAVDPEKIEAFRKCETFILSQENRRGKVKAVDLKAAVREIVLAETDELHLKIDAEPAKTVRPSEVMQAVFGLSKETLQQARIIRTGIQYHNETSLAGRVQKED